MSDNGLQATSERTELAKAYDPSAIEEKWAAYWVAEKVFDTAEYAAKAFTMLLPPPNVTGRLHMGHMLNQTEMDILARWHRMCGERSLWVPGTDHAGIATQMMVEKQLASEGTSRKELGRQAFLERVWSWKKQYGGVFTLYRSDGGQVTLAMQADGGCKAATITDRYGNITNLNYYSSGTYIGKLKKIIEPAGRWIQINYVTYNNGPLIASIQTSNGQTANYNYQIFSGTTYTCLTSVVYNGDVDPNNIPYQASYTYQADNTGAGLRPLLLTCDDPHFQGPLTQIKYTFHPAGTGVTYGQIQNEISTAYNTAISTYTATTRQNVRGDGPSQSFGYSYASPNDYLISYETDFENNSSEYGYDPNDYLSAVVDRNGHQVNISRDPYVGKPMAVSGFDNSNLALTTSYDYGSTAQVPYPMFPYWVMNITDPRGHVTAYVRDTNHRPTKITYPDLSYETFTYNNFGEVASHRRIDGDILTFLYDATGRLYQSTDTFAGVNHWTYYYYDSFDRVNQITDANGHNTFFAYNARHRVTKVTHNDTTFAAYTYDKYGNCLTAADELSHVTSIVYDAHNRPISITVPVNSGGLASRTNTFSYERGAASGTTHTQRGFGTDTLQSGKSIKRAYTGNGRLQSVITGYGTADAYTNTYAYDPVGNLLSLKDSVNVAQATYTYDNLNRRSTLTDALGHVTTWNYYGVNNAQHLSGWLQSVTSPGNNYGATLTTQYTLYDAMGRLQTQVDPYGHTTGRAYDGAGRLQSLSDANGAYTYSYDTASHPATLTFPDSTYEGWGYDPAGNMLTYRDRMGNVKTITYDDRNRPTAASWNGGVPAYSWGYDAASRLIEADDSWAGISFSLDDSGAITAEKQTIYNTAAPLTVGYQHDVDGNVFSISYPSGDQPAYSYNNRNACSGLGTLSRYDFYNGWICGRELFCGAAPTDDVYTAYNPQANGRMTVTQDYKGDPVQGTSYGNISLRSYGYYPNGQMSWFNKTADGGQSGSSLEDNSGDAYYYEGDNSLYCLYHECGNITQTENSQGDSMVPSAQITFPYSRSYASSFYYDSSGNRTATNINGAVTSYSPDGEDRYIGYGYDANGNITSTPDGWVYTYWLGGKLASASNSITGAGLSFSYDALGRVCSRYVGTSLTYFFYAGAQRIEERSGASLTPLYRYYYDMPGNGRLLCRLDASNNKLFYLQDARGYTTHLVNSSGTVVEQYLYDAFGNPTIYDAQGNPRAGNLSAYDNRYLFNSSAGYEWLPTGNMYYARARYYAPNIGRWLAPDPIGFAGGDINLYRYCNNDPVNMVDPSGLDGVDTDQAPIVVDGGGGGGGTYPNPGDPGSSWDPGSGAWRWGDGPQSVIADGAPSPAAPASTFGPMTTDINDPAIGIGPSGGTGNGSSSSFISKYGGAIGKTLQAVGLAAAVVPGVVEVEAVVVTAEIAGEAISAAEAASALASVAGEAAEGAEASEGAEGITEGASSLYDTSITSRGSQFLNVQTNVGAQEFQSTLISNGFSIQTTGESATILSNGESTYTIYTRASTGLPGAQFFGDGGSIKFSLGGP